MRISTLEEKLEQEMEQKGMAILEIDDALDRLPEGIGKTILYDCYVAQMPMKRIAANVGYSLKHCYKLRKQAIEQMEVEE